MMIHDYKKNHVKPLIDPDLDIAVFRNSLPSFDMFYSIDCLLPKALISCIIQLTLFLVNRLSINK